MNQQALIEKVAEAAWASDGATSEGGKWDNVHPELKAVYHNIARAALAAYAEASGERVVTANSTGEDVKFMLTTSHLAIPIVSGADLKNGEELVVRKVGT